MREFLRWNAQIVSVGVDGKGRGSVGLEVDGSLFHLSIHSAEEVEALTYAMERDARIVLEYDTLAPAGPPKGGTT